MRGAVRNTKRWKGRRAPTQDPSTDHLMSRTGAMRIMVHEGRECWVRVWWECRPVQPKQKPAPRDNPGTTIAHVCGIDVADTNMW